jgi:hypothetical protein
VSHAVINFTKITDSNCPGLNSPTLYTSAYTPTAATDSGFKLDFRFGQAGQDGGRVRIDLYDISLRLPRRSALRPTQRLARSRVPAFFLMSRSHCRASGRWAGSGCGRNRHNSRSPQTVVARLRSKKMRLRPSPSLSRYKLRVHRVCFGSTQDRRKGEQADRRPPTTFDYRKLR